MTFKATSEPIDVAKVRNLSKLEGEALAAVLEYAKRLSALQEEVKDRIFMVMRVYTAKPRTNGDGYKGLIHQPNAKAAPSLINGIKAVRNLHYRVITETGMTTADEMLYPEKSSVGR